MDVPSDSPPHVPDPARRSRVLALTRSAELSVEIFEEVENWGVDLTFPEALTVAVDLNLAIARIFKEMATHLDREDGTVPEWERQITEWWKKERGTERLN